MELANKSITTLSSKLRKNDERKKAKQALKMINRRASSFKAALFQPARVRINFMGVRGKE